MGSFCKFSLDDSTYQGFAVQSEVVGSQLLADGSRQWALMSAAKE